MNKVTKEELYQLAIDVFGSNDPPPPKLRKNYAVYIASPEWRAIRELALERDGHKCRICNSCEKLEAHHRTYQRLGDEMVEDLTTLCSRCHWLYSEVEIDERLSLCVDTFVHKE